MPNYVVVNVTVTDHQKKRMVNAVHSKSPFSLKLTHGQLSGGPDDLHVTPRQKNKMEKHLRMGKGIVIKFSARQLGHMAKKGGFLMPLIASLAGAFLPGLIRTGVDFIGKKASGQGINTDLQVVGQDDEYEGGFVMPLLLSLLGGAAASAISGAVEGGIRKKAGLNNNIIGTGLRQMGQGMDLPFKKKKSNLGNGLYQLGKRGGGRMQAYQNSDSLRVL